MSGHVNCTLCATMMLAGFLLTTAFQEQSDPAKVKFEAIIDTTCSDCQHWMLTQLKPIWTSPSAKSELLEKHSVNVVAASVTRHTQGHALNDVVNCASRELKQDAFFKFMFCWESSVEAWTPNGDGTYSQAEIDIHGVVKTCMSDAADRALVKDCTVKDPPSPSLPAGFNEVPWITIGSKMYTLEGDDDTGVTNLAGALGLSGKSSSNSVAYSSFLHNGKVQL